MSQQPGSPIASAGRRVKKMGDVRTTDKKVIKKTDTTKLDTTVKKLDLKAPKKLDFRRHSYAVSTSLLQKESGVLFSPAYRGGLAPGARGSGSKKISPKKQRAKSVFVKSPTATTKRLIPAKTTTTTETGLNQISLPLEWRKSDLETDEKCGTTDVPNPSPGVVESNDGEPNDGEPNDGGADPNDNSDSDGYLDDPNTDEDSDEGDYYEEEFDPFIFIKHLAPLPLDMKNRKPNVPKKKPGSKKITLALDLDETLVHCSVTPIDEYEFTFPVEFNGVEYKVYVRIRPYMKKFLEEVSKMFELVLFTASQQVYADALMDIIDPGRKYIPYRIFRDSCVNTDGNYLKDLHIIGRDMAHVAIVDNSVQAFGYQLNNGIPIESWFDDPEDVELLTILEFLKTLEDCDDVRPIIREAFRIEEFVNSL